jgi:hypothetical protein
MAVPEGILGSARLTSQNCLVGCLEERRLLSSYWLVLGTPVQDAQVSHHCFDIITVVTGMEISISTTPYPHRTPCGCKLTFQPQWCKVTFQPLVVEKLHYTTSGWKVTLHHCGWKVTLQPLWLKSTLQPQGVGIRGSGNRIKQWLGFSRACLESEKNNSYFVFHWGKYIPPKVPNFCELSNWLSWLELHSVLSKILGTRFNHQLWPQKFFFLFFSSK